MATRHTPSSSTKSTESVLFGFALLLLFKPALNEFALQLSHLLCAVAGDLFRVLPSILLVALDPQRLSVCVRMLASFWPLHFLVGAA